jgi:hypothetical protein
VHRQLPRALDQRDIGEPVMTTTIRRMADPFRGIPGDLPAIPPGLDLRDHATHAELVEGCDACFPDCDDCGPGRPCVCTADSTDPTD